MHTTSRPHPQPPRLPLCIPTTYRSAAGEHLLSYPRSPWNPARYLVVNCSNGVDTECVHDDFGNLVPMRRRVLNADFASSLFWTAAS